MMNFQHWMTTLGEYWEHNPRSHCHDMMGHINRVVLQRHCGNTDSGARLPPGTYHALYAAQCQRVPLCLCHAIGGIRVYGKRVNGHPEFNIQLPAGMIRE